MLLSRDGFQTCGIFVEIYRPTKINNRHADSCKYTPLGGEGLIRLNAQ